MPNCKVESCDSNSTTPGVVLFHFPTNKLLASQWLTFCGIQIPFYLDIKEYKFEFTDNDKICSKHFDSEAFEKIEFETKTPKYDDLLEDLMVLKPDAIPTLHRGVVVSDEEKKTMKRKGVIKGKKTENKMMPALHDVVASEDEKGGEENLETEMKTKSCYFIPECSNKCVIGGCSSSVEGNSTNIRLHRFTKRDKIMRNKWIEFVKSTRDDLEQLCFLTSRKNHHSYAVCSWHFTSDQYQENQVKLFKFKLGKHPRLKGNAVPHVRTATNPFPDEFFADHVPHQCSSSSESPASSVVQDLLNPSLSYTTKLLRLNSAETSYEDSNDSGPSTSELELPETIQVSIKLCNDQNDVVPTPSPKCELNEPVQTSAVSDSDLNETFLSSAKDFATVSVPATSYNQLESTIPTSALNDLEVFDRMKTILTSAVNESANDAMTTTYGKKLTETIQTSVLNDSANVSTPVTSDLELAKPIPTSALNDSANDLEALAAFDRLKYPILSSVVNNSANDATASGTTYESKLTETIQTITLVLNDSANGPTLATSELESTDTIQTSTLNDSANVLTHATSEPESTDTIQTSVVNDSANDSTPATSKVESTDTIQTSALNDSANDATASATTCGVKLTDTIETSALNDSANVATSKLESTETIQTFALNDSANGLTLATSTLESTESIQTSALNNSANVSTDTSKPESTKTIETSILNDSTNVSTPTSELELAETTCTSTPKDMNDTISSEDMTDNSSTFETVEEIANDTISRMPRIVQPCAANSGCAEFFVQPEKLSARNSHPKETSHQNQVDKRISGKTKRKIQVDLDVFERLNQLKAQIGMRSYSDVIKELLDSYEEDCKIAEEDHEINEEELIKNEEDYESDKQDLDTNGEEFVKGDENCEREEDTCIFTLKNEPALKDEESLQTPDQSQRDTLEIRSSSTLASEINANQVEGPSEVISSSVRSAESSPHKNDSDSSFLDVKEEDSDSLLQKPPPKTSHTQTIVEHETGSEELDDKNNNAAQEGDEDLIDLFKEEEEDHQEDEEEEEDQEEEDDYQWKDDKNDENYDPYEESNEESESSSGSDWDSDAENYPTPKKRKKPNPNRIKTTKSVDVILQAYPLKLKCKLCQEMLGDNSEMKQHIVNKHGNQETLVPKKHTDYTVKAKLLGKVDASETVSDLEVSVLSARIRLCTTCQEYIPEVKMNKHIAKHVPLNYMCEKCGVKLKNYSSSHVCLHKRKPKKKHKNKLLSKPAQCDRCGKKYANKYQYGKHLLTHLSVKPFQCSECGKGFCQNSNLKIHMRIHSGDKPYTCDLCTEAYTHKVSLKAHKKKVHGVDM